MTDIEICEATHDISLNDFSAMSEFKIAIAREVLALAATPVAAQPAAQSQPKPKYRLTRQEAETLCTRDEVDEAIREFAKDCTGDNAIAMARCIVETWLRYPTATLVAPSEAAAVEPANVLNPVEPRALMLSIEELERWDARADGELLTQAESESVSLVLHELKRLRTAAAEPVAPAKALTYSSTQETNCAGCGKRKHTPLRIDAMGGYVCLTCIDQKLGSLLGEFGYPEVAEPVEGAEPAREALANWAAERWHAEVANRPMVNVHRRALDDTWRQVLRHLGVDDRARLGPTHDELRAAIGSKEWAVMNGGTEWPAGSGTQAASAQAGAVPEALKRMGGKQGP